MKKINSERTLLTVFTSCFCFMSKGANLLHTPSFRHTIYEHIICKNCNTPFIPKGRADSLYCDRIMPGFKDKCSVIGALNAYKSKLPDIEADFYAARRRYNTRVSRNPLLKTEFEAWKIKSRQKLTEYRNSKLPADEFKKWFMDDTWTKI